MRRVVLLVVAVAPFATVTGASSEAHPSVARASAPVSGHIVFTSSRDGDADVYAADTKGRVAALTRNRARDSDLVLARNGRWVAVQREYGKLVLISGDGRHERSPGNGTPVGFSPNSRLLAYTRGWDDERMFVRAVPDGRARALGIGYPISFSPDGRLLAFSTLSDRLGVVDVVTARQRVFPRSKFEDFFGWSPDSRRIAVGRSEEEGDTEITILLVADVRRLSSPPLELFRGRQYLRAEWLTAARVGFERERTGLDDCEVGLISADGGPARIIGPDKCFTADWSPRGDRVAYTHALSGNSYELLIARAEGNASVVVDRRSQRFTVQWSRTGRWLALATDEPGVGLRIVGADGGRPLLVARGRFDLSEAPWIWSPNDRHIVVSINNGLSFVSVPGAKIRRVWSGGAGYYGSDNWVASPLSRRAPKAAPAPPIELAAPRVLRSRGVVYELGADGTRVAALLGESRVDCDHLVGWVAGTQRVIRFNRPTPTQCPEYITVDFAVTVDGTLISWKNYFCGNDCYVGGCRADFRQPLRRRCSGEDIVSGRPPRPAPPDEVRRGVSIRTSAGTIRLRRQSDGRVRTIRPPGGVVDAELENDGLYYAFNLKRSAMRGRIIFIPFESLFP